MESRSRKVPGLTTPSAAQRRATQRPAARLAACLIALTCGLAACSTSSDSESTKPESTKPESTKPESTGSESGAEESTRKPRTTAAADKSAEPAVDASYTSEVYNDAAHWLCNPSGDLGACDIDRDVTEVGGDLTTKVVPFKPATDPDIDCFYVYPTVSTDATPNSDLVPDAIERITVAAQFSRFGSVCRQFAPAYRQITSRGLVALLSGNGGEIPDAALAYNDVLDAWRYYLAHENNGRGVVIIGHSQGSSMLTQLLAGEIEKNARQAELVVSALLIGWNVIVPDGKDVGGSFKDFAACRTAAQLHCVVAYSSFRATDPPGPGAAFGYPRGLSGAGAQEAAANKQETLCVNPAELLADADGPVELQNLFWGNTVTAADPTNAVEVSTRFVSLPGLLSGSCTELNGANYLEITINGDPADPRIDDIVGDSQAGWGLHRLDMQLAGGDLVDLVAAQSEVWMAAQN